MSDRLKTFREKRMRVVTDMRGLTDSAVKESRDLTAEELDRHGKMFAEAENFRQQIEVEERTLEMQRQDAAKDGNREQERREQAAGGTAVGPRASQEYRSAFNKFLALGRSELTSDETRALAAGVGSQGGFTIASEQLADGLIKFTDDAVVIRPLATKLRVTGASSLGVPSLDSDPADADWTSEIATGSEDSAMGFGKRKMQPNPLAKRIKVSNDLLRSTTTIGNVEALVRSRLGYKFGVSEEKGFLTGHGANQPLGVFTASPDGIPTSRDVSTGNSTTAIGMDGLIAAKYALKDAYRMKANWLFHRNAVEQISKLKDSQNQYLWQPSVQAGQPDRLFNLPIITSEFAPNTFTTGLYVGLLGDFSFYWIVDSMDLEIQRLVELYAETNQTGFIGRAFTDGQPVLGEAFARVKLA